MKTRAQRTKVSAPSDGLGKCKGLEKALFDRCYNLNTNFSAEQKVHEKPRNATRCFYFSVAEIARKSDVSYIALKMLLPGQRGNVIIDVIFGVTHRIYGGDLRTNSVPECNYLTERSRFLTARVKPSFIRRSSKLFCFYFTPTVDCPSYERPLLRPYKSGPEYHFWTVL